MEKAILKTLIYADIFDYPLKAYEIHKWLIGKSGTLLQVEKALTKLVISKKVLSTKGFYCLKNRENIISLRFKKEVQSKKYLQKAKIVTFLLRAIPWLKLVGISGGLALDNAGKGDDIDLFVITKKGRIFLSRLIILGLFTLVRTRRKKGHSKKQAAGKICLNLILEEDKLEQEKKDLYIAHEVLQMKPLWQKDNVYFKYLSDNSWVFTFLPNWISSTPSLRGKRGNLYSQKSYAYKGNLQSSAYNQNYTVVADILEKLVKFFQLKYIGKPKGDEQIKDGALYFHPQDKRGEVLKNFKQKLSNT